MAVRSRDGKRESVVDALLIRGSPLSPVKRPQHRASLQVEFSVSEGFSSPSFSAPIYRSVPVGVSAFN